ncbi:hypothetical protein C5167_021139 [Papaver somniferum]|uniref:At4g15545-like C-terminal domain-containing protein n=1 Tax=Papaver somniferum TaxID=3469 RepID=A0A4Y7IYY6_PAPSO|nr:hypothetical protein C5167_021139 [Papaver somniferum]
MRPFKEYCLLNVLKSDATPNGYSTSRSLEDILLLDPKNAPLVPPLNLSTKGEVVYCVDGSHQVSNLLQQALLLMGVLYQFCNKSHMRTPQIDGKEIFRQARSTLSYEQFSAFLSNIKELNCQNQTR